MNEPSSQRHPPKAGHHDNATSPGHGAHADQHHSHGHGAPHESPVSSVGTAKDPVCGMVVSADSAFQTQHAGNPYYFCS
ncbi:hypothetical protein NYZ00_19450, partial [Acinetobacter baumannii]|nr:hypothetical protein [Acinetobacter baumannii]